MREKSKTKKKEVKKARAGETEKKQEGQNGWELTYIPSALAKSFM